MQQPQQRAWVELQQVDRWKQWETATATVPLCHPGLLPPIQNITYFSFQGITQSQNIEFEVPMDHMSQNSSSIVII